MTPRPRGEVMWLALGAVFVVVMIIVIYMSLTAHFTAPTGTVQAPPAR